MHFIKYDNLKTDNLNKYFPVPSTAVIEGDVGAVLEGNVLQILSNNTRSFEFVYDKHFSEKNIYY